jgi:hypothetical protein
MIEQALAAAEEQNTDLNSTLNNLGELASTSMQSLWGMWG